MKKVIIVGIAVAVGTAPALANTELVDLARDGADAAAKVFTATGSSAPQYDGTELTVTNEITGVQYHAPMFERVQLGQIEATGLTFSSTTFDLV